MGARKEGNLIDLKRERMIDQVCSQEPCRHRINRTNRGFSSLIALLVAHRKVAFMPQITQNFTYSSRFAAHLTQI
jgi:hypothetical protein